MSIALAPPVFDSEFGRFLPTAEQTLLLRACLRSGEPGRRAWEAWLDSKTNRDSSLEEKTLAVRSLRLLLLEALRKKQIEIESGLATLLRTATLKEELRYQIYRRICSNVLAAFAERGIEVV